MYKLKFSREDKKPDAGGWILDYDYLIEMKDKLNCLDFDFDNIDLEEIEVIILTFIGEENLLKESIDELI